MKFTDEKMFAELRDQIEPRMAEVANGKSARDVAAEIYGTLPDKSVNISAMMADEVVEIIERYHADVDKSLADDKAFINEKLAEATKNNTSPADRCAAYHRILVSLAAHAIYVEGGENAEAEAKKYIAENSEFSMSNEDAKEKEAELHDLTVEAIANSELVTSQLPEFLEAVQDISFDSVFGYAALGRKSSDLKLILAMQAYVNVQRGFYSDISADTTLEQIVYNICGTVDTVSVAAGVESGEIEESSAVRILRAVGIALGCLVSLLVLESVVSILSLVYVFSPFIAIVLGAFTACYFIAHGLKAVDSAMDMCSDALARVGYFAASAVQWVLNGLKKLVQLVAPKVAIAIAWTKDKVGSLVSRLKNGFAAFRTAVVTTEAQSASNEPIIETENTSKKPQTVPDTVLA